MARKKSQAVLEPFLSVYPQEVCIPLNEVAEPILTSNHNSPTKMQHSILVSEYWYIICYWIAYEIQPWINIYRPPYSLPIFEAFRTLSKLFYNHLKLCQVCVEKDKALRRKYNNSPWKLWVACMLELKQFWADSMSEFLGDEVSKGKLRKYARYLLADLRRGDIPQALKHPKMQHNLALCKSAQELRTPLRKYKTTSEVNDLWLLFTNSFQRWIEDFRHQSFSVVKFEDDKAYYCNSAGQWKLLKPREHGPYPDISVDKLINSAPLYWKRWSEMAVYFD